MTDEQRFIQYVSESVNSGVEPLSLYFEPIYDCFYGETNGFRAGLRVNSTLAGTLGADDYLRCRLSDESAIEFSLRAVKKAVKAADLLEQSGTEFKRLTIRCFASLIKEKNLYKKLNEIKGENGAAGKICVEFGAEIMKGDLSEVSDAFSSVRSAGMSVAADGYGGDDFPLEKILTVCPDFLFLDKKVASLVSDKEKGLAVAPIINLARNLGGEAIATGVKSDDELKEFKARECAGFIPDKSYKGILDIPKKREFSLAEITATND